MLTRFLFIFEQVPHLEVRKTIARRAPSRVPMLGDRVPFVIASGPKGSKNAMLARDPVGGKMNSRVLDTTLTTHSLHTGIFHRRR